MEAQRHSSKHICILAGLLLCCQGCVQGVISHRARIKTNAIPAHRLPAELRAPARDNLVPLDFTKLRRAPLREHVIGTGDILGVYIEDVLAVTEELPAVNYSPEREGRNVISTPSVGHPLTVNQAGSIVLPIVGELNLKGLTLRQALKRIRQTYEDESIITDQTYVSLDLIRARTVQVFVLREDATTSSITQQTRVANVLAKRGSASTLELPIYDNDVLHAITESGGLPGVDAFNEIWVLRSGRMSEQERQDLLDRLKTDPDGAFATAHQSQFVRIPLRVCPGQQLPFSPSDVILEDGDVVFIESREIEFFTTGGLIGGGKYAIPRDHDVDILEAIAIANGNVAGPSGNATATNFRSGPGNIVAPTDVVVLRKLPNGEQIKILVDLRVAMNNPNERIAVMPRDMLILRYKPSELLSNIALNFINFNYAIPN